MASPIRFRPKLCSFSSAGGRWSRFCARRRFLAKPLRTGVTVKASALADELAPRIESLAVALSDVQRESREAQLTMERKSQAAASWKTPIRA